jgi:dihydrofolate reductase
VKAQAVRDQRTAGDTGGGRFQPDAPDLYVAITRFKVIGFIFEDHAAQSEAKMRNVIFAINITLDGCCDHTKMIGDEEIHEYFTHLMRDVDLLVFGRKTYQLMVPFWPDVAKNHSQTKAMNKFAQAFDSINKLVFSRFETDTDREGSPCRHLRFPKGDWKRAHESAQQDEGIEGAWVHAYLHRKEGDQGNAAYWYNRAGKPVCHEPLDAEWLRIARALLKNR